MAVQILYNGQNPFGTRTPFVSREYLRQDRNGFISGVERLTLIGTRARPYAVTLGATSLGDSDNDFIADSDNDEIAIPGEGSAGVGSVGDSDDDFVADSDNDEIESLEAVTGGLVIAEGETTCVPVWEAYKLDMDLIRSYFSAQFKELQITSDGDEIYFHPAAKIVSISFPESSFSSFYQFQIVIDCIDDYGSNIIEPVDEWSTDQSENGTTTYTHTVSARGVGSLAFENAQSFVLSLANGYLADSFLISRRSFVNRFAGEFRLVETFVKNEEFAGGYGLLTYQTSVSESDGETIVEISGEIQVARIDNASNHMVQAKTTFDTIDFQAIAQAEYTANGGAHTLASVPRGMSVTENYDLGTVSFNMSWSSQAESSPYIIDTSTVKINKSGGTNCFVYTGKVKSDSGCQGARYAAVKTFFEAVNWDARVLQNWVRYGTGEVLTANAKSKSITYSPALGEISFSVEYCADPEIECGAIEAFKYTMSWTPSIERYAPNAILDGRGFYDIQDLGFKNRKGFSISGSARRIKCFTKEAAKGEIRSRVNLIMIKNFPGANRILLSAEIEEDKTGDFYSFSYSWNANAD